MIVATGTNLSKIAKILATADAEGFQSVTAMAADQVAYKVWVSHKPPQGPTNAWCRTYAGGGVEKAILSARRDLTLHSLDAVVISHVPKGVAGLALHLAVGADGVIRSFQHDRDANRFLVDRSENILER